MSLDEDLKKKAVSIYESASPVTGTRGLFTITYEVATVIILILQMRRLRFREAKPLAPYHTVIEPDLYPGRGQSCYMLFQANIYIPMTHVCTRTSTHVLEASILMRNEIKKKKTLVSSVWSTSLISFNPHKSPLCQPHARPMCS